MRGSDSARASAPLTRCPPFLAPFRWIRLSITLPANGLNGCTYRSPWSLAAAIAVGIASALVAEYLLDKRWIFYNPCSGLATHARKISRYALIGLDNTAIFLATELTFYRSIPASN